jgi:hypothetical protein
MNDLKKITDKMMPYLLIARKYMQFIFFIFLAILVSFLMFQIRSFTQTEPSDDAVTEKLKTVQRPNIDANALSKIQQLQDQNVQVKSLFQTRSNPFSE